MSQLETIPIEVIYNILLQLPYDDIINYCRTNIKARDICNDNYFWLNKLNHDFSAKGLNGKMLVPSEYMRLYQPDLGGKAVYERWKRGMEVDFEGIDDDTGNPIYDLNINADITIFRLDRDSYSPDIIHEIYKNAIRYGNIDVLNKLQQSPTESDIMEAIRFDQPQILDWLISYNIVPTREDFDYAIDLGKIHILDWFEQSGIIPNQEDANAAATAGQLDTLLWLEKRGILPNPAGMDSTIAHDNLETINWLLERNILPSQAGINMLAQHGHLDTLKFLEQRGMIPNQNGANKALLRDRMDTLSWLEERNILPNTEGADSALRRVRRGNFDSLNEYTERNIFPNIADMRQRDWLHRPGVPKWLLEHKLISIDNLPPNIAQKITGSSSPKNAPIKVYNPESGHFVIKGGATYKKLVKRGVISDQASSTLTIPSSYPQASSPLTIPSSYPQASSPLMPSSYPQAPTLRMPSSYPQASPPLRMPSSYPQAPSQLMMPGSYPQAPSPLMMPELIS